jgi:hypothetical protein
MIVPRMLLALALIVACSRPADAQLSLRFDYSGAEAILEALERDSLSDAAVDSLVNVPAVRDMIRVTTGFSPASTLEQFRDHVQYFAKHKRGERGADRDWRLGDVWRERARIRALIGRIRSDEKKVVGETVALLGAFQPQRGPLEVTVYFYAGGNSGGGPLGTTGLYANLQQADGDYGGVVSNIAHEVYHVMQNVAWRSRPELAAYADDRERLPVGERLLVETLAEGTANFVVDPRRSSWNGAAVRLSRERYQRNTSPERIRENFALFETLLDELTTGETTWREAYNRGFASAPTFTPGSPDAQLYFVGYQMAEAIHAHCGPTCVSDLFGKPATAFFQQYISLYRDDPEIIGRFSAETEKYLFGPGPFAAPAPRAGTPRRSFVVIGLVVGIASAVLAVRKRWT